MTIGNSILVALIVMFIVFVVLLALSLLLKIEASVLGYFSKEKNNEQNETNVSHISMAKSEDNEISAGELMLIDVEESTAAMIMALTSDELKIPLKELQFKSIRALD